MTQNLNALEKPIFVFEVMTARMRVGIFKSCPNKFMCLLFIFYINIMESPPPASPASLKYADEEVFKIGSPGKVQKNYSESKHVIVPIKKLNLSSEKINKAPVEIVGYVALEPIKGNTKSAEPVPYIIALIRDSEDDNPSVDFF
jgi:hypothetical protein